MKIGAGKKGWKTLSVRGEEKMKSESGAHTNDAHTIRSVIC